MPLEHAPVEGRVTEVTLTYLFHGYPIVCYEIGESNGTTQLHGENMEHERRHLLTLTL